MKILTSCCRRAKMHHLSKYLACDPDIYVTFKKNGLPFSRSKLKIGQPECRFPNTEFSFTTVTSFVKVLIENRTSADLNDTFEKVVHL